MPDALLRLHHEEHDGAGATTALRAVLGSGTVVSHGAALDWRQESSSDDGITVVRIEALGEVEVVIPRSPQLVVLAVRRGALRLSERDRRARLGPGDLGVIPLGGSARLSSSTLQVDLCAITAAPVARMLGVSPEHVRLHAPNLRRRSPALAACLERTARLLVDDDSDPADVGRRDLLRRHVVGRLTAAAIDAFDLVDRPERGADRDSAVLQRAVAFMGLHLRDPVSMPEVASAAGLSVRGLQLVFRRRLATSPLLHLRRLRLEAARQELTDLAVDGITVAAVADRYGFSNAARFSTDYRAAFQESPAAAIRRIHDLDPLERGAPPATPAGRGGGHSSSKSTRRPSRT